MSTAFDYAIAPLGALESSKAFHHTIVERDVTFIPARTDPNGISWRAYWTPPCQGHDCRERPVYVTRYRYVTGRQGRTTDRIQYACAQHGAAFAKKHNLPLEGLVGER